MIDPITLVETVEALGTVGKEIASVIAARNAGVPTDAIVAAVEKLMDEASGAKMAAEFPQP